MILKAKCRENYVFLYDMTEQLEPYNFVPIQNYILERNYCLYTCIYVLL